MKTKILAFVFLTFFICFLTGCGRELSAPYDSSQLNTEEILSNEISGVRSKGFASDLCVPTVEGDVDAEDINAEAFALFDTDSQKVISQKNLFEKVYPASTTKIMTCLLALELCDPEEYVTVPKDSEIEVSGSSMADLKPGDRLKMKDMLYALMVPSGNDAAVAIAMHISGSQEEFADLMNRRASKLGATHTHFVNPHGLPDEAHYTCVYDMYLIFNEAMKNSDFREISSTAEKTVKITNSYDLTERSVTWTSGNGFYNGKYTLPDSMVATGGKTGHTNAAGFCLVLGEKRKDGKDGISIIMKAPLYEYLYDGMIRLTSKFSL